jgi:hypothetical protein
MAKIIIVVDGAPTQEKQYSHGQREAKRAKELDKLRLLVENGAAKPRISKSQWKKMNSLIDRTYRISPSEKISLVAALKNVGFNVVVADGEADVWIARQPATTLACITLKTKLEIVIVLKMTLNHCYQDPKQFNIF